MDARNSLLAALLFVLAILLIAPMAVYNLLRTRARTDELQPSSAVSEPFGTPPRGSNSQSAPGASLTSQLDDDSQEKLRELIARKNDQLARQRDELNSKELALEQLQSDYDNTLRLVEELLGPDEGEAEDGLPDAGETPVRKTRQELEAELQRLRKEMEETRLVEMELMMEIEQLRETSAVEMAEMQLAAQQALDEQRMLQQVASQALVESGDAVLPVLVLMLRDERPRIRSWAADVLGGMGPRAGDAIMPLSELANSDADERVRDSARRALRAIRD